MNLDQAISETKTEWESNPQLARDRDEVIAKYGEIFKRENIDNLTAEVFQSFLRFENNKHWNRIQRPGGNLIKDMNKLKRALKILLDESKPLSVRIEQIRNNDGPYYTPFLANAIYSPILLVVHPKKYPVVNEPVAKALDKAGLYAYKKYSAEWDWVSIPAMQKIILDVAKKNDFDLWQVDWVWWKIAKDLSLQGRYWSVSPGEDATDWTNQKDNAFIGIHYFDLGPLTNFYDESGSLTDENKSKLRELMGNSELADGYEEGSSKEGKISQVLIQFNNFMSLKPGDKIVAREGKTKVLGRGTVTGGYQHNPEIQYCHTFPVDWFDVEERTLDVPLNTPGTIFEITKNRYERIFQDKIPISAISSTLGALLSDEKYSEYEKLLLEKSQMIFYGPPGTGKTYNAKKFANLFIKNNLREKEGDEPALGDKKEWFEYITKKLEEIIPPGYEIDNAEGDEYFAVKSQSDEKRIRIFYGNKEKSDDAVEVGFKEKSLSWLSKVPKDSRFFIIINLSNSSYVILPYSVVKNNAQFRGGENWDSSGEKSMWFTMTSLKDNEALIRAKEPADEKQYNCKRFLFNLESIYTSDLEYVTFHPSYSYEEFMEGIRARATKNSQLEYYIEDGIFKRICKIARLDKNKDCRYILIIDEINRGNISKIFGELITTIEKDKRDEIPTVLTYSNERFRVPKNVFVVGTMNTADRSLVQIDIALRRRFGFIEFMPNAKILENSALEVPLPQLMTRLNKLILEKGGNREHQIGHSYFMKNGEPISTTSDLQFAFKTEIIPLIQEYFYHDYNELEKVLGPHCIDVETQEILKLSESRFKKTLDFILENGKSGE